MDNENRNDYAGLINQLKLTMFNIIAAQESKLSGLVSYLNNQPQGVANDQLLEMYNKQRNAVSSLTIITNDLGSVLGQLDYNDSVISDILSNESQLTQQVEPEMPEQEVSYEENQNVEMPEAVETTDSSMTEETMASDVNPEAEETVSEGFIETPTDPEPVQEIPVETPIEETPITETPIEETPTTETTVSDNPIEETPVTENVSEDASTESVTVENVPSDGIIETTDTPISETLISEDAPITETKEENPEIVEAPATNNDEVKDEVKADSADNKNDDKVTEVITENSETPVEEKVESTDESTDKVTETKEEVKEGAPVVVEAPVVDKSSDVITEELDSSKDEVLEEKPSENVIQIKAESLDSSDDVSDTPIASLSDEKVDESSETTINFVAVDPNFSRAILINKKQSGNLRKSLLQQTELFNSFTVKNKGSNDIKITSDNLEEMLDKATALYSQEKVEEAEALMQKIDEFRSTQAIATR